VSGWLYPKDLRNLVWTFLFSFIYQFYLSGYGRIHTRQVAIQTCVCFSLFRIVLRSALLYAFSYAEMGSLALHHFSCQRIRCYVPSKPTVQLTVLPGRLFHFRFLFFQNMCFLLLFRAMFQSFG
jgi:hypothetical protein